MVSFFVYILSLIALTGCNASLHSEQIEQVEHEQDYAALVEFYNAMGGEEWINSTNWCSDLPLEQWYGVYTHQGRVYAIDLAANNLSGNLPRSIASLSELKYLNLASNSISGSIPQSYGGLSNLVRLSLYNNRMSGDIPAALNKMVIVTIGLTSMIAVLKPLSLSLRASLARLFSWMRLPMRGVGIQFCSNSQTSI